MKVLGINLYYKLPDDFDGSYEDAILNYLRYRKDCGYEENVPFADGQTIDREIRTKEELWEVFLDAIQETEYKACGSVTLSTWNDETGWVSMLEEK